MLREILIDQMLIINYLRVKTVLNYFLMTVDIITLLSPFIGQNIKFFGVSVSFSIQYYIKECSCIDVSLSHCF